MIIPVILSGGSGTRLWPLSRKLYPKQLLSLTGDRSLLQQTVLRVGKIKGAAPAVLVCNEEHRFLIAEQLREITTESHDIILEPIGRNTAPAVGLSALHATQNGEDPILLILPADHTINNFEAFEKAVAVGVQRAESGRMVTFGIVPESPETGYGYIKKGSSADIDALSFPVAEFVEKPDLQTAEQYVNSGDYLWNSGMFMFRASQYLSELKQHAPEMLDYCQQAYAASTSDLDFLRLDTALFAKCPSDSIDYAVMEKTDNADVIPVDPGWSDIGSWTALWDIGEKDDSGNVTKGDIIAHDTQNSYVHASHRLVTTLGVSDHVIVETADAVMVAHKDKVQDIKQIVNHLQTNERPEANLHRRVFRPWGSYETVSMGNRFQVKLITVNPGQILSSQMHHHRAEHWIVVKGTARIFKGDKDFLLSENESTYIPLGVNHRLENPGVIPLELIEVQSGSYLGEDDIIRFEDNYGRVK